MKILLYFMLFIIVACSDNAKEEKNTSEPFSNEIHIDDDFYFEKGIYQVVDNVYVAIGYGLANSILIVGDTGNIIICLLYTSPSPRDLSTSRMPSSA